MTTLPDTLPVHTLTAPDGVDLAYRILDPVTVRRTVVLVHGFLSNGFVNWVRYGHAATLADAGFRVIMPDLRGHGHSAHPHDPSAYPPDILVDDIVALMHALDLHDCDLAGYSLGSRTSARLLVRGANVRRVVFAGMGLGGMTAVLAGEGRFQRVFAGLGKHERGTPEWRSEAFMRTTGTDPIAAQRVLASSLPVTVDEFSDLMTPALVLMGADDDDHGSGRALADTLPIARYQEIPGNHMGAVAQSALGVAIRDFLVS